MASSPLHPHDCPPECRQCALDEAWEAIRDELDCDVPVVGADGAVEPCWQCARCDAEADAFLAAIRDRRKGSQ